MKPMQALTLFGLPILVPAAAPMQLNVTAIGAHQGSSTLECWQMDSPFTVSSGLGASSMATAVLGGVSNITYTIFASNFDAGPHNAPYAQWVVFLYGAAYVTLPDDDRYSALITGGPFGIAFAADTQDVSVRGHRTQYPGITETIGLQIPTADGKVPAHLVLHPGPCSAGEIVGIQGFGAPA
ncbi:hypothetical protein F5Y14DRAFT_436122 [Nemania sp. NC0429]|nr:hypothetical protein F5Y14DRAFT_436122 [Nemania sp. NC0429]